MRSAAVGLLLLAACTRAPEPVSPTPPAAPRRPAVAAAPPPPRPPTRADFDSVADVEEALRRAELAMNRNDPASGADWTDRALEIDPEHPGARLMAARIASYRGEQERASHHFERLLARSPDDVPMLLTYARQLTCANRVPDYERAFEVSERAVALEPENPFAHGIRGYCLLVAGRFEEAAAALERAVELDPRSGEAWFRLGSARHYQGRTAEAEAALRRAVGVGFPEPEWRWALARAIRAGGRDPAAERAPFRFAEVPESRADLGLRFEDVAGAAGLDRAITSRGSAFLDFDGDGRLDLLVATSYEPAALYRNEGGWRFRDVTAECGLAELAPVWGTLAADLDDDGDPDLLLTRGGWFGAGPNVLLRNDGGRFVDATEGSGVADRDLAGFAVSAADVDGDGRLDVHVANLFPFGRAPNRLWRNLGGLRFEEVADAAGVADPNASIGCCFGDYDDDGRPDLYVNQIGASNRLYRNVTEPGGPPRFVDVAAEAGVERPLRGFVAFFLDHDQDGDLDLFASGFASFHDFAVSAEEGRPASLESMNALYRNDGGTFSDVTWEAGLRRCYGTMGANFGDLDGDGRLDVALGNGGPEPGRSEPNAVYFGAPGARLLEAAAASGLRHEGRTHGIAVGDVDGDGLEDLFVPTGGAFLCDLESPRLYRFLGEPLPSVTLRLVGTRSNRDAVGARVTAVRGDWRLLREVSAGVGFGCTNGKDAIFHPRGEGPTALHVRWPSGRTHTFPDVPPGRFLLREDSDALEPLPLPR